MLERNRDTMRPNGCETFIAFKLKLLNFLQAFIGISLIIYSSWMFNRWNKHSHIPPTPSSPSPQSSLNTLLIDSNTPLYPGRPMGIVSGFDIDDYNQLLGFNSVPAPWFIYAVMGMGAMLCVITCVGYIAAEAINGCCLCFYSLLATALILLEGALVAFIWFDSHWEKDFPDDSTGQLDSLRLFIEANIDICKWIGLTVIMIQAFSLLLAMILRGLVSRRSSYDSDDDYAVSRSRTWQPLLNPDLTPHSGSSSIENRTVRSDIWSTRMREKYGLHGGEVRYNSIQSNPPLNTSTSNEGQRKCSIL